MINDNLQIRHIRGTLTTITNNKTIPTIHCNKSYMNVVSLSLSQNILHYCTHPSCDDVR